MLMNEFNNSDGSEIMYKDKITVIPLAEEQISEAVSLVWEVFSRFEAPEYSAEGIKEFRSFLDNESEMQKLNFYGAFIEGKLAGVLAMRQQHISLFFVDEKYHRRGIGKNLFETMQKDFGIKRFTVNSSPYAVKIYERLGFKSTDTEQITNGIRYTPMHFTGGCKTK